VFAALLLTTGCGHTEPFGSDVAGPNGPQTSAIPRQLTFNPGDDRSPAGSDGVVLFSRYDPTRATTGHCIAVLPSDGGTLEAELCPPLPTPADTFVSTWLEPARSPDGRRVAFIWQRGAPVSALAAWSHHLVIASVDAPGVPLVELFLADTLPPGRRFNTGSALRWADSATVRLVVGWDSIFKVKGGGAERFTDTAFVPEALMTVSLADAALRMVPGGDSVIAHTDAPGGGLWVVKRAAPATLVHLDAAGTRTTVGAFTSPATDLAVADGRVVAATGLGIEWLDAVAGGGGLVTPPGPVHRLTAVGGRRLVAEVERDAREFGAPANLWLFELPPR
jgi:hypothetical protein